MKKQAILFIVIAGVLWGTSGIFVHLLAPYGYSALQMTALRGTVALFCMLAFVLMRNRGALRVNPRHLPLFLGIGISLFGTAACYFVSMQHTSVATAVVLMYTAPVYVLIFSVLFLKERLSVLKVLAVAGMLIGCALVSGIVGGLRFDPLGILMGVLAGVAYGGYNILTKIALQKKASPFSTTLYGFLFMSVIALSCCQPLEILSHTEKRPALLIPLILALGLVTYIIPYTLYTLAMRVLPAGTTSALGIMEPMSATLFGIFLLNEPITPFSVVGIVLILGCAVLLSRPEPSKPESQNQAKQPA